MRMEHFWLEIQPTTILNFKQISEYEQNTWGRTGICSICFMMGKLVFEYEDRTVLFSLGKLVCVCLRKPSEVH